MQKQENNYDFIDSQNVNLGIQHLGWKLNFARFRRYLREKYNTRVAYLFIGYIPQTQKLYSELQKAGYVLMFKPTLPDGDGNIKGNIDADMVLQTMIDYGKYDKCRRRSQ